MVWKSKRGFIDLEFEPAYVLLSLAGGLIGYFVASYASEGFIIPVLAGVGSTITTYLYLAFTS